MLPLPVLLQAVATQLSDFVESGNAALCHPIITALQWHGIWLTTLLASLWILAGRARLREVQRQRRRAVKRRLGANSGSMTSIADEQEVRAPDSRRNRTAAEPLWFASSDLRSCACHRLAAPSCLPSPLCYQYAAVAATACPTGGQCSTLTMVRLLNR
jgi:hypothetical protein